MAFIKVKDSNGKEQTMSEICFTERFSKLGFERVEVEKSKTENNAVETPTINETNEPTQIPTEMPIEPTKPKGRPKKEVKE